MKIELEIKTCQDCPFWKDERVYTADSWDNDYDWFCTKTKENKISKISGNKDNYRKIAGYVGTFEGKDIKIPKWCPQQVGFIEKSDVWKTWKITDQNLPHWMYGMEVEMQEDDEDEDMYHCIIKGKAHSFDTTQLGEV